MKICLTIIITVCSNFVLGRDFYIGMLKKNDILMAQDRLYKERVPYSTQYAKYGRYFKCPITYFRVVDRLGIANGPRVEVIRGGLLKKYIVIRLTSVYNQPISVNIYVGCENKMTTTKRTTTITALKKTEGKYEDSKPDTTEKDDVTDTTDSDKYGDDTTDAPISADTGTPAGPDSTDNTADGSEEGQMTEETTPGSVTGSDEES